MIPRLLSRPWLQVLFYGLSFAILGILLASRDGVTNDTWWHLRTGQELWAGTFSFYDSWSWTAEGAYWPAHELGFEWILYGLWLLGGNTFDLMGLLNIGLVLGAMALLIPSRKLREKLQIQSNILVPLLVLGIGYTILGFVQIRAQGISFFLFALTIRLILSNKPYWIPVIFLAWVWLHGSVFMGVAIAGFATLIMIARWLLEIRNKEKRKDAINFSIAGILALVATCLSPLGIGLWTYFFQATQFVKTNVEEWRPLSEKPFLFLFGMILFSLVLVAIIRLWKHRYHWELLFLVGGSLFLCLYSISVMRIYSNFALISVTLVSLLLMSFTPKKDELETALAKPEEKTTLRIVTLFTAVLVVIALFFAVNINSTLLKGGSVEPFEAGGVADTLRSDQCKDALWNDYDTGSYMIWFLRDIPVSLDSRYDLYPEWVTAAAGVITREGDDSDPTKLLNEVFAENGINCMIMNQNMDSERLEERGLTVLAENTQFIVFEIPKTGIPPRIED